MPNLYSDSLLSLEKWQHLYMMWANFQKSPVCEKWVKTTALLTPPYEFDHL